MKRILILAALFTALIMQVEGQVPYIPDAPLESFHLATDRDLYLAGETIWFTTCFAKPLNDEEKILSQVIYAELFDASYKIIARGKFLFEKRGSSGQLKIPGEQISGVYFFRVYTQYLRNFHPGTWPMKALTIINPSLPLPKKMEYTGSFIAVYPSGGRFVSGIPSEVALYIRGTMTDNISGIALYHQDTVIIPEIKYFSNGLGYFKFIPLLNHDYYLLTRLKTGDTVLTRMAAVEETGILLNVSEKEDHLVCEIHQHLQNPLTARGQYHLAVNSEKFTAFYRDSVVASSPVTGFILDKKLFSPGRNYIILSDHSGNMLDAAIWYNLPADPLNITIRGDGPSFMPRQEINLELDMKGKKEEEIIHASVTVVKKGTLKELDEDLPDWIIEQPTLLTPQMLNGYGDNENIRVQLNILMIIYRNLLMDRQDVLAELKNDKKPLDYIPETRNVSISGYVRNRSGGEPSAGSKVFLSYVGGPPQIHMNETQPDGFFSFPVAPYRESQDLFLCTFDETPGQEILIINDFANEFPVIGEIFPGIDTSDKKLLEQLYINQQVHALKYPDGPGMAAPVKLRELGFVDPEISIRLEDYIDLPSMEVVMNEIIPFVKVRKRKGDYKITILDSETGLSYENHLVLVDNIPLNNLNELMQIHPASVEQIDVINRTYVTGDHTFQGIIMVKTNTGNFGGISLPEDAVFIQYPLITPGQGFMQAKYDKTRNSYDFQADFRNVLYWNPDFNFSSGNVVSFFASDHLSDYDVIIDGVTSEGRIVFGRATITIRGD